jgi:hypothetical protein
VTLEVFFALFDSLENGRYIKDYLEVVEMYNLDVFGYSNDQAYVPAFPSRNPMHPYQARSTSANHVEVIS